ncbi:UNVERIFIED_ORG: polysaccharide pyruvyl transferase WcaK-like protein [Bacillus sp. B2I3]|nr:polysaccharide pyruvyl transferase WcaK-like protein [Bacillus sp. B2I3]
MSVLKKVLYIGWIGFGNLGDELLWNVFKELNKHYNYSTKIEIVPSLPGVDINHTEEYDTVILGGGSLLLPGYMAALKQAIDLGKDVFIWGSGLDWITKEQLDIINSGQSLSLEKTFTEKDIILFRETLEKAAFVGVRGPITKKVLETFGITSDKIKLIGDPGILLNPPAVIRKKEKIAAINWGTTFNRLYGQDEAAIENALLQVSRKLIKSGYKILLYVVWGSDREASKRLYDKLNDPLNVTYDPSLYSEEELIEKLSVCSLSINFKLHANILSLAGNVPCIALGYRFKVFDLFQSLGLENLVVSTDSDTLALDIMEGIREIELNNEKIIEQYKNRKEQFSPLIIEPIKNNFTVD